MISMLWAAAAAYSASELDVLPTPRVDQLEAQIEAISDKKWKEDNRIIASDIAHKRMDWWLDCMTKRAAEMLDIDEPTETLATAIVEGCPRLEAAFLKSHALSFRGLMWPGDRMDQAQRFVADTKRQVRGKMISIIVAERGRAPR